MYATINLPGSSHFKYFGPASRADCEAWINQTVKDMLRFELLGVTLPRQIISNKDAAKWRYRDGSRVFRDMQLEGA